MAFQDILMTPPADHVGTITLNRPEQMNTFSTNMATELNQALLDLDADSGVRVILLKGAGKAFCAGIDVNELAGKPHGIPGVDRDHGAPPGHNLNA